MNLELKKKTAFIAGSSEGLGFATAVELAREGAQIVINGRSLPRLKKAEKELYRYAPEAEILICQGNLLYPLQIKKAIEKTIKHFKKLDILITNAGGPPAGDFKSLTQKDWDLAFKLTLKSTVHLIQQALPYLKKSKAASILTITSTSAKQPIPGLLLSNVFRPAVLGLTKTLANELGTEAIRVNTILPGWTATERSKMLLRSYAKQNHSDLEKERNRIQADIPLNRMATPAEFAKAAAFLVSPAASYITGTALSVDGGRIRSL